MIHVLYKSTNLQNGRFYIGVHSTEDVGFGTDTWIDAYIGSGTAINRALKKHGRDVFDVEVIAYFDSEDAPYDAEKDIVTEDWLKRHSGRTYNLTPGGNKPPKATVETVQKIHSTRKSSGANEFQREVMIEVNSRKLPHPKGMLKKQHKETTKQLMSQRNAALTIVSCPNCAKSGGLNVMKRWHYDNCKKVTL